MRTVIVLALALAAASVSTSSNANEITISQIGDRLSMDIVQDGEDHVIKKKTTTSKIDGDDVTFIVLPIHKCSHPDRIQSSCHHL